MTIRTSDTKRTGIAGTTVHLRRQAHPIGGVLLMITPCPVLTGVLALAIEVSWCSIAHFQCVEAVSRGVKVIDIIHIQISNTRNYQLLCDNQYFKKYSLSLYKQWLNYRLST
jgi:hypothetical protein